MDPGDSCDVNGDCCGFDSGDAYCVNFDGPVVCAASCFGGEDCASGCCVFLQGGDGACAPAEECF